VVVSVAPDAYRGLQILGPNAVVSVSSDSRLNLSGEAGFMSSIEAPDRGRPYTVTSVVPLTGDEHPLALTANKLRAAGTDYPVEVRRRYLRPNPAGTVGPEARRILALAEAQAQADAAGSGEARTPYDLAVAWSTDAWPTEFDYTADISDLDCGGRGVVECFALLRKGFCQYYASTAAVLLREDGVPTRFVQGFLPGERAADGTEIVRNSGAHAWVEVYFPGYGWVMFDPTGGGLAENAPVLQPGQPVARPSPTPVRSPGSDDGQDPRRSVPSIGPGSSATGGPGSPGAAPFVAVGLLLAAAVGWLAFSAYRRGREVTPDSA
jgi:transglutaminase-like putative cysteine protease